MSDKERPRLEVIAGELSDDKVREKAINPGKKAYMSFGQEKLKVDDYAGFMKEITRFMAHYEKSVNGGDLPEQMAFGRAQEILAAAFQKEGGYEGAYKAARKDLPAVFERMANALEQRAVHQYQNSVLAKVDPFDWDTHVSMANQYIDRMKAFAPDVKMKSAEQMAHNWQGLAIDYANMQGQAKSQLKAYNPKAA
ncbi:TPA: hypothetical protein HA265_02715 [Candidatus Woesearchaeota archaeon]|nr:hypothetical protein [Candidatus Woesearchaeota archaeon]